MPAFSLDGSQELLRLAVVGSVDDGKSTLIGRLLYETGSLFEDQIAAVQRASRQNGGELDFSLFTDGLKAEREQAITIDVAYRYFSTARRKFIVVDTPGHLEYTRNMATGASRADAAVVIIDARLGVQPQTRRHAYLIRLLGIDRLAVAVNKMDLLGFDQARFEAIRDEFLAFAGPLRFSRLDFIPIAARTGDNVCARSPHMPWAEAGTVLDYLESVPVGSRSAGAAFRFPVQVVLRPNTDYRGLAGQIASGEVCRGDEVVVLPSGRRTRIRAIETPAGECERAFAPMSVTLRLADEVDASRGDLLAHPDTAPALRRRLEATLVWLAEPPLQPGRPYLLRHTTRTVPARVTAVHGRVDLETLAEVPVDALAMNDIGRVCLDLARPVVADPYADNRSTGAFVLVDPVTNATVGAGMISQGAAEDSAPPELPPRVSAQARAARLGHLGAVVYVDRPDEAVRLERGLFELGVHAGVASSADAALALAEAGLVALFVRRGDDAELQVADVLRLRDLATPEAISTKVRP